MIEISIIFIILIIYGYLKNKYRFFEADTNSDTAIPKKGRYRYFGISLSKMQSV